jgi:hypothetical protein
MRQNRLFWWLAKKLIWFLLIFFLIFFDKKINKKNIWEKILDVNWRQFLSSDVKWRQVTGQLTSMLQQKYSYCIFVKQNFETNIFCKLEFSPRFSLNVFKYFFRVLRYYLVYITFWYLSTGLFWTKNLLLKY